MPAKPRVPLVRNQDSLFEQEARASIKELSDNPLVSGRLIKNVALDTAVTRVPHQLGRPFVGWKVVDQNAPGTVHRDPTDASRPQDAIPLIASGTMTVTLWVF